MPQAPTVARAASTADGSSPVRRCVQSKTAFQRVLLIQAAKHTLGPGYPPALCRSTFSWAVCSRELIEVSIARIFA